LNTSQSSSLQPPAYPSVQGQTQPDLNLAGLAPGAQQTDLSQRGNFADSMPPQNTAVPTLKDDGDGDSIFDDLHTMGIDEKLPYFDLNLAGEKGFPTPSDVANPSRSDEINTPTFTAPNFSVPDVKPFDLTGPGLDHVPPFQPDPHIGDLLQFDQPEGLVTMAATDLGQNILQPDPMAPDLGDYDRPAGLDMPGIMTVDPALPDLQSPQLTQDVQMMDRPGDLAPGALDVMALSHTFQQVEQSNYPDVFYDANGANTTRRRHFELMMRGLGAEER